MYICKEKFSPQSQRSIFRHLRYFVDLHAWTEEANHDRKVVQENIWNAILDARNTALTNQNRKGPTDEQHREARWLMDIIALKGLVKDIKNRLATQFEAQDIQDELEDEWVEFGRGWIPRNNSYTTKVRRNSTCLRERLAIQDVPLFAPGRNNNLHQGFLKLDRFLFGDEVHSTVH